MKWNKTTVFGNKILPLPFHTKKVQFTSMPGIRSNDYTKTLVILKKIHYYILVVLYINV